MNVEGLTCVADEHERREGFTYCLEGVHIRHISGRDFVATRGEWAKIIERKLLVVDGDTKYPAEECFLLSTWNLPKQARLKGVKPMPKPAVRRRRIHKTK